MLSPSSKPKSKVFVAMKLATLKALVIAVEEGSLRSAAREIGVSQPALTKMIRELEIELAAPLLVRSSQGVLPTAQGKVLYEHAKKVAKELSSAADQISQLGGAMRGELNIAAVPVAVMLLIPEALRTFARDFPEIRHRVSEDLYMAQLQRLRTAQVDIAIGGIPGGLSSGEFITEALMETTMVVVARKRHPRAGARRLAELVQIVPIAEGGLPLTIGDIIRSDSVVSPVVRHFISHLHRAARHISAEKSRA